jgi:hypothetical protein
VDSVGGGDMTEILSLSKLSQLFGSYKAEWLQEEIYDLFTEPAYFPGLKTPRPCIIEGGRGAGKTTVLKGLSYEGQFAFVRKNPIEFKKIGYMGLYHRVDTNHVMAFDGLGISEEKWSRIFGHYFNLIICESALIFWNWYRSNIGDIGVLTKFESEAICTSLGLSLNSDVELLEKIKNAKIDFQSKINSLADAPELNLSLQEAPISLLFGFFCDRSDFKGKTFFLLIDEYENFQPYQQRIVNTILKHSGKNYSIKLGVRELGWRNKTTLNSIEPLNCPADYVLINIVDKLQGNKFEKFARRVVNARISQSVEGGSGTDFDVSNIFPSLTMEAEAVKLGVGSLIVEAKSEILKYAPDASMSDLEIYFIYYWAKYNNKSIKEVFGEKISNNDKWQERYENYKYAILFSIKHGKVGLRKYYCGWSEMVRMSEKNIRYLMELVEQSLTREIESGKLEVSPENQTLASQSIGKKNISLLSGMTTYGAQLTRLLLGLGRFFQILAAAPEGHAPEINQFKIDWDECGGDDRRRLEDIIDLAVMHLALVRGQGTKPTSLTETKDYEYMVHPIFSSFFEFSNRRKRKIQINANHLLGLIDDPKKSLTRMLSSVDSRTVKIRGQSKAGLPAQMTIFGEFYE